MLSVITNPNREAALAIASLTYGVEPEVIDRDGNEVYVDIEGNPEHCLRAALSAGAKPVAFVDMVPRV